MESMERSVDGEYEMKYKYAHDVIEGITDVCLYLHENQVGVA